ncbi:MAG: CRISPR system precrRNA processing endoribonuclease RAMP protein Cas6 [Anaerolineae bacterium]|nr:CRISPR system precrRNA processing endoribonuclease RAMP protein Cas6 [Anaerolineae bacterium]
MFPLTATHLRFVCEATTPLRLEIETYRAGQNLRGALGAVMTRAYCAGDADDPAHIATCPVHWLLAANEKPGQERRGYAIVPPLPQDDSPNRVYESGERFEFGITLFGRALKFLPYFVLAVPEMGRLGVGIGRGKFVLKSVWAENPLTRERECLLAENDNLVRTPTLTMTHAEVMRITDCRLPIADCYFPITIDFLTPTRLIEEGDLAQAPAFDVLFARLLKRLDDLAEEYSGGTGRPREEIDTLEHLAARVQLVESHTRWVEVWSGSTRRGKPSPLSGIVGRAVYTAERAVWRAVLPWLLWGQLAQVGKSTVKGNGVMVIAG